MPLRQHLFTGVTSWTEIGHRYSWRMKLRSKTGSRPKYYVKNLVTGEETRINLNKNLSSRQIRKMKGKPDMILEYAHFLKDKYKKRTGDDHAVFASAKTSLNYRPRQHMFDRNYDLSKAEECFFCEKKYLLPLAKPRSFTHSRENFLRKLNKKRKN